MPASLTHYFFAKKIYLKSAPDTAEALSHHKDALYLGAQGPDFLFFSLFNQKARALGSAMHNDGIKTFFRACVHYANRAKGKKKDILFAYLSGFICHYISDYTTHPYVLYKTGFEDISGKIGKEYGARHHFFETAADSLLCKKYTGKTPAEVKLYRAFDCPAHKKSAIAAMYKKSARLAYGKRFRKWTFTRCISNMILFYRAANDRAGIKTCLIKAAERVSGIPAVISSLIHIRDASPYIEYLNLSKKQWPLPWDDTALSSKTFLELMDEAVKKAVPLVNALYEAMYKNGDIPALLDALGDNSFSTGLPASCKPEFRFMEITNET